MNAYAQWDPFSELRKTMDNLFDQGFARPWRLMSGSEHGTNAWMAVNIWETEDALAIEAAIPGVDPADVDIKVINGVLTIKAEPRHTEREEQRQFYHQEVSTAGFSRAFSLPVSVDPDKAEARYEHGMLYLSLPKAEAARPKQIKIGATNGNLLN